ncbi:MAG: glycoside hydrolase family 2 TIM barrel-domain containing protein, partial [Candidatus Omnitrophica bacterium]|nr:glycoside hydrolase family 2 TIM barrel-domain containing protein [Candidatus Omnitrophota bacterium]
MHKRYASSLLIVFILFLFAAPCFGEDTAAAPGSVVKVTGKKGSWSLEVNGKAFYIKGAGVGKMTGLGGANYLKMAQELGANAVRTWGTDQGTQEYFDTALKYGLMVDAGIWLNYAKKGTEYSYIGDNEYKRKKRQEITDYVNKFKGHPALLMWNIGNEAIFFTKDEEERAALAKFLGETVQMVHKLDPDHPVIYTSADTTALPYIQQYVPGLDIFGMNIYGSVRISHGKWDKSGLDMPYCVTEYGPHGPWDVKK